MSTEISLDSPFGDFFFPDFEPGTLWHGRQVALEDAQEIKDEVTKKILDYLFAQDSDSPEFRKIIAQLTLAATSPAERFLLQAEIVELLSDPFQREITQVGRHYKKGHFSSKVSKFWKKHKTAIIVGAAVVAVVVTVAVVAACAPPLAAAAATGGGVALDELEKKNKHKEDKKPERQVVAEVQPEPMVQEPPAAPAIPEKTQPQTASLPFFDPNAKVSPHTEWRFDERSRSFETAGKKESNYRIGGINGINTLYDEAESQAMRIQNYSQDNSVEWVYNCTHSAPFDIAETLLLNHRGISAPAALLQENWQKFHEENLSNPDAKYLQICHSQGGSHVKNALLNSTPELRDRVIVVAIAPAAVVPDALCHKSYNYVSKRDVVPYGEIAAHLAVNPIQVIEDFANLTELIVLDPHPDATLFDHSLNSPTFEEVIKGHIFNYLKIYGHQK